MVAVVQVYDSGVLSDHVEHEKTQRLHVTSSAWVLWSKGVFTAEDQVASKFFAVCWFFDMFTLLIIEAWHESEVDEPHTLSFIDTIFILSNQYVVRLEVIVNVTGLVNKLKLFHKLDANLESYFDV